MMAIATKNSIKVMNNVVRLKLRSEDASDNIFSTSNNTIRTT
jgi:hypothetical protein